MIARVPIGNAKHLDLHCTLVMHGINYSAKRGNNNKHNNRKGHERKGMEDSKEDR